jgi:hypothetical protein
MEFSVCYEFAVQRRIPWDEDQETLRSHIRDVRHRVAEHVSVEDVRAESDLGTSRITLEFVVFGTNRQTIENDIRDLIGSAIRDSGAYHQGLFPVNEEMRLRPTLNTWSGLRTPTWRVRRSSIHLRRSLGLAASG